MATGGNETVVVYGIWRWEHHSGTVRGCHLVTRIRIGLGG